MTSGVLGVAIAAIFSRLLVPRQDWVAEVVVQNKARARLGSQVLQALEVIKHGHLAIAAMLVALVGLQLLVAVDHVVEARVAAAAALGGSKGKAL
jgi:hypothetical protein